MKFLIPDQEGGCILVPLALKCGWKVNRSAKWQNN